MGGLNKKTALQALWGGEFVGVIKKVSQLITPAAMTDNTNTTGYIDLTNKIPANTIILGWKATVAKAAEAWDDDTTAVIQVGKSGTLDDLSTATNGSIAAAGTVGASVKTSYVKYNASEYTVRVTITGGSDFTAFVTAAAPRVTVDVYYIELN
jgi:hypothetical protein